MFPYTQMTSYLVFRSALAGLWAAKVLNPATWKGSRIHSCVWSLYEVSVSENLQVQAL